MTTKGYRITIARLGPNLPTYVVAESAAKAKSLLWYKISDVVDYGFKDYTSCVRCPELDGLREGTYPAPGPPTGIWYGAPDDASDGACA